MSQLKAPNGKPSNLTPEQWKLVRTPQFKSWFGDWENDPENASKVVDENGEPLVVYHGTQFGKFSEFEKNKIGRNYEKQPFGFYFTNIKTSKQLKGYSAEEYANKKGVGKNPHIFEVFLNVKNPIVQEVYSERPSASIDWEHNELRNELRRSAFTSNKKDGVIAESKWTEVKEIIVVVLDSNQIKLADGSNTTFDSNNPDIRFAEGGEIDKSSLKEFANSVEAYQSNHYGSFNRDELVEKYLNLPDLVKQKISPRNTKNLFRGADSFTSKKSAISFTKNRDFASFFGAYTIPFSAIKTYEGLIDTKKLGSYLSSLKIKNEVGDDEGEVIVIKPTFFEELSYDNPTIDQYRNEKYAEGGTTTNKLKAPNGKPSNLTPEQWKLVRTPQFKAWFGDWENDPENASKVVDDNGEPLVVYHGTSGDLFYEFMPFAVEYIDGKAIKEFRGNRTKEEFDEYIKSYGLRKIEPKFWFSTKKSYGKNHLECFLDIKNIMVGEDIFIQNKQLPIDVSGVIIKEQDEDYFFVLNSTQIKLADGSNTTFDGKNPDIRFAEGGEVKSNSFMKWYIDWYKGISDKMFIAISLPNAIQPFKEKNVVILDVFEKKDQSINSKPYLKKIVEKANEYGVVIYLKPKDNIEQYQKFAFELTPNKQFMKRIPHFSKSADFRFAEGGTTTSKLKAPNGKPSNLTPEQWKLVRTPQFKAWFGDWENDPENASKVVDENGEPLVVYHGTNNQFTKFKLNPRADSVENNLYQTGLWFFAPSFDKSMNENERAYFYKKGNAEFMAETWMANKDEKGNLIENKVIKAFLNVRKPKIVNGLTDSQAEELVYYSEKMRQLKKNDAVIMHGCVTDGNVFRDDINVLEPNQIKLADGSNTTFDGNNPDIRFAEGGTMNTIQQGDALIFKDSEFLDFDNVIYVEDVSESAHGTIYTLSNGQSMFETQLKKKFRKANEGEINRSNIMSKEIFSKGGKTRRYMKKIKRGGITYGKSHAEGGIPVKNQSTGDMLEVEGGEGIVNKRSMASKSRVKLNGKEMTICEAVSQLNQMEGGVKFSCEDVSDRQFIKAMAKGGELERGTRTEQEHIQVLKDLYAKRITPKQASERIAKDHLKEDSRYYSKLAKMEGKMAKGGKVKNDYNVPSTEDLVNMVTSAREKQIKKVKQSGVPIVIGRNDGYYFKTFDSPNYSEEILSSRPSKRKVIEIIESNPNITEVYFQGSIRGGDYIGDVDFDIVDDFAVLLWKKPIDVNNAIGTTLQWTETEQDPKNEDKEIRIDPRVYMIVKQEDAHIYKDRPTDDKYFYLNSYLEKNGEQSSIRIPKLEFQNLIEEGELETIEVSQALKEQLLKPMKTYSKGGKMADGGKTRKNAKKTLTEVVGFDINSIDISKL